MSLKAAYRDILREIRVISQKSHKLHQEADLKKQKAVLEYQRFQLLKERKPTQDVDEKLKRLTSSAKVPDKFEKVFKSLFNEDHEAAQHLRHVKLEHAKNVGVFLKSQRVYTELIERYNPGLTMRQSENVEKSANRVGLKVPQ